MVCLTKSHLPRSLGTTSRILVRARCWENRQSQGGLSPWCPGVPPASSWSTPTPLESTWRAKWTMTPGAGRRHQWRWARRGSTPSLDSWTWEKKKKINKRKQNRMNLLNSPVLMKNELKMMTMRVNWWMWSLTSHTRCLWSRSLVTKSLTSSRSLQ